MIPAWIITGALRAAPWAAAMAIGAGIWHATPIIGPRAVQHRLEQRLEATQEDLEQAETARDGYKESFRISEQRRGEEAASVATALEQDAQSCNARVEEARRAAGAIRSIVRREVPRDPQGCPERVPVPTDSLRDALQPGR